MITGTIRITIHRGTVRSTTHPGTVLITVGDTVRTGRHTITDSTMDTITDIIMMYTIPKVRFITGLVAWSITTAQSPLVVEAIMLQVMPAVAG